MAQVPGQPESPTPDAPDAPDAFKAELQALYGGRAEVSGSVDDAVRAAARQAFAGPAMTTTTASPRQTGVLYRIAGTLAAAAALGLVLILSGVFSPNDRSNNLRPNGTNPRLALTGDVNADDTINIVDAYLLQRRIEQGGTLESTWDLTGDGEVDAQEVRALAAAGMTRHRET